MARRKMIRKCLTLAIYLCNLVATATPMEALRIPDYMDSPRNNSDIRRCRFVATLIHHNIRKKSIYTHTYINNTDLAGSCIR